MTKVIPILSDEQKVNRIVEALRTASGNLVFQAFCQAPSVNLGHMRDMIDHILANRDDWSECECEN